MCVCVCVCAFLCTQVGADNMCNVHVSLVPVIGVVGEQKTKPTQHSVQVSMGVLACVSCAMYAYVCLHWHSAKVCMHVHVQGVHSITFP